MLQQFKKTFAIEIWNIGEIKRNAQNTFLRKQNSHSNANFKFSSCLDTEYFDLQWIWALCEIFDAVLGLCHTFFLHDITIKK